MEKYKIFTRKDRISEKKQYAETVSASSKREAANNYASSHNGTWVTAVLVE